MTQSLESISLIIILVSFSQVILNSLVWLIKGNSYFLLAIIVIFYNYCNYLFTHEARKSSYELL